MQQKAFLYIEYHYYYRTSMETTAEKQTLKIIIIIRIDSSTHVTVNTEMLNVTHGPLQHPSEPHEQPEWPSSSPR